MEYAITFILMLIALQLESINDFIRKDDFDVDKYTGDHSKKGTGFLTNCLVAGILTAFFFWRYKK